MGDSVTMVAFSGVENVPQALSAAEHSLRETGLVAGSHDPEAVLAWHRGKVLRPGPKAGAATRYGDRLGTMLTNGVAFIGERYFHAYGIGFADWFHCPACDGRASAGDDVYGDQMGQVGMAAMDWIEGKGDARAECLLCHARSDVTDWRISDSVFLADMAVEFWNWPHLGGDAKARAEWWYVDVVPMLEAAVGAPAMVSGHKI